MKKILSLFLAVILAFGVLPVVVLAADPTPITSETYAGSSSVALTGNKRYKLVENESVVIEEGATWTVSEGSELYVYGQLVIKGTLIVNGYVTAIGAGEVVAKCWNDGGTYKYATIVKPERICGNESNGDAINSGKRYFAEVHVPEQPLGGGFNEAAHKLVVKYMVSRTGNASDYLNSDLYLFASDPGSAPYVFQEVYTSPAYDPSTGMLKVPLNQYLYLHFEFTVNGAASPKYDGNRMAILFNRVATESEQGVCAKYITGPGAIEYYPAALANDSATTYTGWKDSYFVRQERIYIPTGKGYSASGVNGEISATDQTVRLDYGQEFKFRVKIDSDYSESDYAVYLVQGYKWNARNYEGTMDELVDEVYFDETGTPHNCAWKFAPYRSGANQKAYIDSNGIYHIASVDDEFTIVVTGVVSNDTISTAAGLMDTFRNLLNALKQFFERVKQMLGIR